MSVVKKLKDALEYIDSALDILRSVAGESREMADILEDAIYHLEEAGDILDSLISERSS